MAPGALADSPTSRPPSSSSSTPDEPDKKPNDQLDALAITEQVTRTPDQIVATTKGPASHEKKGIA